MLLLESDDNTAEMIQGILKNKPFVINMVKSGPEALRCIMKERDYDVILCDMATRHPPGLAFYQAVSRIRPSLCERFIFMKGHQGNPEVDSFVRKVKGIVLWKPFEEHILVETIELALKKQRDNSPPPEKNLKTRRRMDSSREDRFS
jgi:DNA-binding NtrC family response regulator